MKKAALELSYFLALVPAIFPDSVYYLGLNLGLGWTLNYLLIWILILILSAHAALLCYKTLKGRAKYWTSVLALLIPLASFFAAKPVYEGDFNKFGAEVDYGQDNIILNDILNFKSDYNGIVCVASPTCPFCIEAVRDKIRFLHKRNKIDVAIYMPADDGSNFEQFRTSTQAFDVPIIANSRPDIGFDIQENVIPVFLYIQDGIVRHVWRNEQLGYPALDWIEKALK